MATKKTKEMEFEKAMQKLEAIVETMEDGELSLEKSIASFEEGMELAKICESRLEEASGRVQKVMKTHADGLVDLSPDEIEALK